MVRTDVPPAAARAPQLDRVTNNPDSFSRGHSLPSGAADKRVLGSESEAASLEQGLAASSCLNKESPTWRLIYAKKRSYEIPILNTFERDPEGLLDGASTY